MAGNDDEGWLSVRAIGRVRNPDNLPLDRSLITAGPEVGFVRLVVAKDPTLEKDVVISEKTDSGQVKTRAGRDAILTPVAS